MDTDDLTEDAYETIRIARRASPLIGAELAVFGRNAKSEDEFLRAMLAHVEEILEDTEDEAEWLGGELTAGQLQVLCRQLKKHIAKTLAKPIAERGGTPFEDA
ncbi:MAG: hypothetical protein ACYC7A_21600 [Thermoanaerobaculia bacterium]